MMEFGRGEYGEIRIHNEVITAIARRATLEVEGVEKIASGFKKSLLSFLGRKKFSRGISIERTHENEVKITISIIVKFGANIPEVANKVQSNVKKALEQVAGITPLEVNVEVEGLALEEKVKEIIEEIEEKKK
jgi:uncharacterized alkaline shock family protein YloU